MEVDLIGRRVEVSSTVIRWTGHGLVRKSTKSRAGQRILLLPSWEVADLQRRRARGVRLDTPVFPNTSGGWRDPKNTRRDFRGALDRAGFDWVTSHSFRKTTATLLDQAGLSARVIADQLGHARPSMTQDVYMGRRPSTPGLLLLSRKHLVTGRPAYRTSRRRQKMGIKWVWRPSREEDRHPAGL
jgi:integrase